MIVLDAGHGGGDPGCVGNGMKEADLTLDICERIKKRLERYQVVVSIAPRGELSERVKYANCCYAELFLSIHVNAGGGTGFESYVYPEVGTRTRKLRDKIHDTIMEYLSLVNVADRGKKEKNFHVLRETKMSAILLECLFIDHAQDAEKLASELFRDQLANEIHIASGHENQQHICAAGNGFVESAALRFSAAKECPVQIGSKHQPKLLTLAHQGRATPRVGWRCFRLQHGHAAHRS